MADLRKLKDKAAELATKGKLERAAGVYRELLDADPEDVGVRQKLAEVLRRSGQVAEAVARYGEVAERFAEDGLLVKAIALCKTILELDPQHGDSLVMLADLHGKRAAGLPRPPAAVLGLRAVTPPITPGPSEGPVVASGGALPNAPPRRAAPETAFGLIMSAAERAHEAGVEDGRSVAPDLDEGAGPAAGDEPAGPTAAVEAVEAVAPEPPAAAPDPRLSRVPLFSDLGRDAFLALTQGLVLHRFSAGEAVLREGERGTSFYVVAAGRLAVTKRDEAGQPVSLAHLGEGDFFGEMALLHGAPRAATVTAEGPAEVLELPAATLQSVAARHPHLAEALRRFYRQRLLANAMAVSPVFRPFGRSDRRAIAGRFRSREVAAGEVIVREGERSDGLYVILDGALDVLKRQEGREVLVGQLREGDLFGEVSCLRKTSATASVVTRRGGTLLRLPRPDFDALVLAYPQILELVATRSEERLEGLDAILSGHARYTEDGLVLI